MPKLDLKTFEKQIKIRQLKKDDFNDVIKLQKQCFPGMKPWKKVQFDSLIKIFPEGQICITYNKKIIASSSSLILNMDEYDESQSWRDMTDRGYITNHDPTGHTLYGIEIMVDPKYRGMKLARRLYNKRKQLAKKKNLKRIIIAGRIPEYHKYEKKMSARQFVKKVTNKVIYDSVLTAQIANDFVLKRLIPNYLPQDIESKGYATLLEWYNLDYKPESKKIISTDNSVRVCVLQYRMRAVKDFNDFSNHCEYFVDVASEYHCDFIVFPEIFTTQLLSFMKPSRPAIAMRKLSEFTPRYLKLFTKLAVKYNINIIGGSHFAIENDNLYNISYLFRRNGTIEKQYKIHITPSEKRWWGVKPGSKVQVFETDKGKIAILICYDIEFPELARIAVQKGANIIFVPFNTDERRAYLRVRYCAQARCVENQIYVAISGCVGNLPRVKNLDINYAQSAIFTPSDIPFHRDGIAAECSPNIETLIFQDLDIDILKKHREFGNVLTLKDRRQDIYKIKYKEDNFNSEV
jgi:predicted amidohydrolase/ribosomal protein S18 acetylase RimI-like enzyme